MTQPQRDQSSRWLVHNLTTLHPIPPTELLSDLQKLGAAFMEIYLQALNGVACDPGAPLGPRSQCDSCHKAWVAGREVLAKYDDQSGNMYRAGPVFQIKLVG